MNNETEEQKKERLRLRNVEYQKKYIAKRIAENPNFYSDMYKQNKEKFDETAMAWRERNHEKYKEYQKLYHREYRKKQKLFKDQDQCQMK